MLETVYYVTQIVAVVLILGSLIAIYFQQLKDHALARAENQREALVNASKLFEYTATHPTALESVRSCLQEFNAATQREQAEFGHFAHLAVNNAEQAFYMRKEKLINQASYDGMEGFALSILVTPGANQWWQQMKHAYGEDIRHALEIGLSRVQTDIRPIWELMPFYGAQPSGSEDAN